jgi:hypothetical protein
MPEASTKGEDGTMKGQHALEHLSRKFKIHGVFLYGFL